MDGSPAVLPVLPWTLAGVATLLVVALSIAPGGPRAASVRSGPSFVAGRAGAAAGGALAVLLLVVARTGPAGELDNPVSPLVVGLGWPLLLLLPALVGLVRRRGDEDPLLPRSDAWPALLPTLAVVAFLVVPVAPTRPAAVGTAVAAYALAVVAASVAVGRRTVAERAEVLGLLARWAAVGRALPRWSAPRGALAVLAVVLGGAWAERYERSAAWAEDLPTRSDTVIGLLTAIGVAGLLAGALHAATRRGGAPGTAAAVLLPLALATAVAGVTRRALISGQLVLDQVAGPRAVDPDPLGVAGGQALALGLVLVGGSVSGAVLARRMGEETARLPGLAVLLVLTAVSAVVVLQS